MKNLYKININYYGQIFTLYRWAKHADFALALAVKSMAKKIERPYYVITNHIKQFDRYMVTKVK